jgi:hypothetical protein
MPHKNAWELHERQGLDFRRAVNSGNLDPFQPFQVSLAMLGVCFNFRPA